MRRGLLRREEVTTVCCDAQRDERASCNDAEAIGYTGLSIFSNTSESNLESTQTETDASVLCIGKLAPSPVLVAQLEEKEGEGDHREAEEGCEHEGVLGACEPSERVSFAEEEEEDGRGTNRDGGTFGS